MTGKKICVLHAQVPFSRGGAELHVEALTRELDQRGFNAQLIQIPYKWYPKASLYDNMLLWRLLDLSEVNGEKIDLVIGTKFPSYGVKHPNKVLWIIHQYRQAYDLYGTPSGLSGTPDGEEIRKKVTQYDNAVISEARLVFANSKNVAGRLQEYNGIDSTPLYHPPKLAGRYICEDFSDYIFSVGRLDTLKRNDLLIQSMPYCSSKIQVKIAGRGPELSSLQKLAKQLNVEDRVEFLGFVSDEDLLKLYANAFAVFFAPVDEDYGYITLEAFLSKKPVVTCMDSGGVLEFVKGGENGSICDPDPQVLGQAIQKLYDNKQKCKTFGENGCNIVKDINWDNVIEKLTQTI